MIGIRRYLQGLVVGGAVAWRQLGRDPEIHLRSLPPYVQMLPEDDVQERERVGPWLLTLEMNIQQQETRNLN